MYTPIPIARIAGSRQPNNPFKGYFTERKIVLLTEFLINRIEIMSPFFTITREHRPMLAGAIKLAVAKNSNRHPAIAVMNGRILKHSTPKQVELTLDDIVEELPPSTMGWDLGTQLLNVGAHIECA